MPLYVPQASGLPGRFIHMPKTGGTWLREVLVTHAGAYDVGSGHDPVWFRDDGANPVQPAGRPFGILREPGAWYLSLYRHALRMAGSDPEVRAALLQWGSGSMEWPDVLYGWTHPGDVEELPERLLVVVDIVARSLWSRNHYAGRRSLYRGSGAGDPPEGLWSWAVDYFFGGLRQTSVRLALNDGADGWADALLADLGIDPGSVTTPRRNVSPKDGLAACGRRWIEQADGARRAEVDAVTCWSSSAPARRP